MTCCGQLWRWAAAGALVACLATDAVRAEEVPEPIAAEALAAPEARGFPPLGDAPLGPHDEPPLMEPDPWLPQWTLPHPKQFEQLLWPGDLVEDTYWLRRPWHFGTFVGTMGGDDINSGVKQATDWYYGLRWGNDFAPHWGWELRSVFYSPRLAYPQATTPQSDIAHDWFLDLNVLHYPWGDTRLRPYWSVGLGGAQFKFQDANGRDRSEWLVDVPLALGCKYYLKPWLELRGELGDTVIFGHEDVHFMNNLSLSIGLDIHLRSFKTRAIKYGY